MCRNIRVLHNFEPPANNDEVRAAALQYVRKVSGATKPSRANEAAFERAVAAVAEATDRLLRELTTTAPPRNREAEAEKARQRWRRPSGANGRRFSYGLRGVAPLPTREQLARGLPGPDQIRHLLPVLCRGRRLDLGVVGTSTTRFCPRNRGKITRLGVGL